MGSTTLLGIDPAKNVFRLHGLDELGRTKLKRTLRRRALVNFVAKLPVCTIAMEACSSPHHFSRKFQQFGHAVKIISPQSVRPFVQGDKNDARMQKLFVRQRVVATCDLSRPKVLRSRTFNVFTGCVDASFTIALP